MQRIRLCSRAAALLLRSGSTVGTIADDPPKMPSTRKPDLFVADCVSPPANANAGTREQVSQMIFWQTVKLDVLSDTSEWYCLVNLI